MTNACVCLWFAPHVAPKAVELYTRVIPGSRIVSQQHFEATDNPEQQADTWTLEIAGSPVRVMGASHAAGFTEAASMWLTVADQAELDAVWEAFLEAGGKEVQCGWITDPFGVSWQVVPANFVEHTESGDAERAQRVVEAVWQMVKIDSAALDEAARG